MNIKTEMKKKKQDILWYTGMVGLQYARASLQSSSSIKIWTQYDFKKLNA